MDRKFAATFLLSLCVVILAASLSFAADRPYVPMEDRASIPIKWAPVYGFGGSEDQAFAKQQTLEKTELGVQATNAIGTIVGTTTYDYQHNGTMGRQVEHRGGDYVHIDWMKQLGIELGEGRRTAYNIVDLLSGCGVPTSFDVHTEYGGYVNLDVWPDFSWAVPGMHSGEDSDHMFPRAYWDYISGVYGPSSLFSYEDHPTDVYGGYQEPNWGPNGLGSQEHQNIWPIIDLQTGGSDLYLHMVCAESGGPAGSPQTISYYRRVGPYGNDTPAGVWSGQCVIDTVEDIAPSVTSSPISGNVVITWTAPADFRRDQDAEFNGLGVQLCNDVWFAKSTNYGQNWIDACEDPTVNAVSIQSLIDFGVFTGGNTAGVNAAYNVTWDDDGGNITAYGWEHDYKAYTNTSCLLTTDDYVHIVWNGRRWTDTTGIYRRQSGIFHWSDDPASGGGSNPGLIRTVVKALYDTGGNCYVGAWQSDVDKMSISECDGKLYVIWAQFGSEAGPCFDIEGEDGFLNGDLYLSCSDDAGFHWDVGDNLTETESNNCNCGTPPGIGATCESENYPTMARYGRQGLGCDLGGTGQVLDITYVNDLCAGGVVQDGRGIWTTNNIMWFSTACREAVPAPGFIIDVTTIGECFGAAPLVIDPDADTTITFTIENPGLLVNNVNINIRKSDPEDFIAVTPSSFTIGTGVDNFQVVTLDLTAPPGAPDPSVYVCTLDVNHDVGGGTTFEIPTCLLVCSEFARPQWAVVATPLKRVRIWNTGQIGSGGVVPGNEGFDYIEECDTLHPNVNADRYLYSASPIVCRRDGADTLRFCAYSEAYTSDAGMRPLGWATGTRDSVVVDSTTYTNFTYAKVEYATADTIIGFWSEYFVPKNPTYGDFMVCRTSFWNMTYGAGSDTIRDVLVGEFLDWDVPTDFRTDTVEIFDGADYVTGNYSGWEKLDSINVGGQWQYSGVLWMQGAEVNDSLEGDGSGPEFPYCATSIDHSTRYAGIFGDPHTPFKNASTIDNPTYIYRAGRTLEPYYIYQMMKNNVGFNEAHWEAGSGAEESTYVDLSQLVTFGEYDLPPGGSGGSTNPRKFTYTFAIIGTPGTDGDPGTAYTDFVQMCKDAEIWIDGQPEIIRHCVDFPGDANNSGGINVGDQVTLVNYVFKAAQCATNPPIGCPPPCLPEGDANGDGAVNIGDAVYIGNYVFVPGAPAPAPFPPEKK